MSVSVPDSPRRPAPRRFAPVHRVLPRSDRADRTIQVYARTCNGDCSPRAVRVITENEEVLLLLRPYRTLRELPRASRRLPPSPSSHPRSPRRGCDYKRAFAELLAAFRSVADPTVAHGRRFPAIRSRGPISNCLGGLARKRRRGSTLARRDRDGPRSNADSAGLAASGA